MKKMIISIILSSMIIGCRTTPLNEETEKAFSYKHYSFEKPTLSSENQTKQFDKDLNGCLANADKQSIDNLEHVDLLSSLYGKKVDVDAMSALKDAQVIECMTGAIKKENTGKGWILKEAK